MRYQEIRDRAEVERTGAPLVGLEESEVLEQMSCD
jgi:hypothetical protein